MPASESNQSIVCITDVRYGICRQIAEGCLNFVAQKATWNFVHCKQMTEPAVRLALASRPTGIVAHCSKSWMVDLLEDSGAPVVNTSRFTEVPFPTVGSDDAAVGRSAATHLLELGLRQMVVIASPPAQYSFDRVEGFLEVARAVPACEIRVCENIENISFSDSTYPLGVFGVTDREAIVAINMAQLSGLKVPTQVAVLGADNDGLRILFTQPNVSSVRIPGVSIGYRAMEVLEELLAGKRSSREDVLLQPQGVEVRGSTDIDPMEHQVIRDAREFLKNNLTDSVNVETLKDALGVNRSKLEDIFRRELGITPLSFIHQIKTDCACKMLRETDFNLDHVSESSGFHDPRQLWRVFKKVMHTTPEAYRRQFKQK